MRKLPSFILRLFGWKIDQHTPAGVAKCVVVMGPHTSNWDFIIGKMSFMRFGIKGRYLIKKEAFKFPFGWLLKRMGGIPVDRSKNNNITDQAVQLFKRNDSLYLVFTPEGTRDYSPDWKKGFYYIAQKANVPIYIGYMDYKKKIGGFHSVFVPTGDVDKDILYIKGILSQFQGRYPEKGIRLED